MSKAITHELSHHLHDSHDLAEALKSSRGHIQTQEIYDDGTAHPIVFNPDYAMSGIVVNPVKNTSQALTAIVRTPTHDLYGIIWAAEQYGPREQLAGYIVSHLSYDNTERAKLVGTIQPNHTSPLLISIPPARQNLYPGIDWQLAISRHGNSDVLEIQQAGYGMTEIFTASSRALMDNSLPLEVWAPPSADVRRELGEHALVGAYSYS